MKKVTSLFLIFAALLFSNTFEASAQTVKKIQFAKGKNSATVRGNTANVTTHTFPPRSARHIRLNVITPTNDSDTAARIFELEAYSA